jgi:sugar lactone lactonase YvrE
MYQHIAEKITLLFQGFHNPHGIAICPNGTTMYVTEIGPNKVWKFSLASGESV